MAYAIINRYAGGTRQQYESVVEVVHPADGLPPGQLHHFAGPIASDWLVIAIWDSRESWERFRDETLMPALQGGVEGGFEGPPEQTEFELHTVKAAAKERVS